MSLKKALATLLATVMMLSLVSCGSKSNEEAPDDASKPTESAESSGKIKVGFSSAAFSDEWCHNLALAFENLTATEYPEIEATVLDGNIDAEKQINIHGLIDTILICAAAQPQNTGSCGTGKSAHTNHFRDSAVAAVGGCIFFAPLRRKIRSSQHRSRCCKPLLSQCSHLQAGVHTTVADCGNDGGILRSFQTTDGTHSAGHTKRMEPTLRAGKHFNTHCNGLPIQIGMHQLGGNFRQQNQACRSLPCVNIIIHL